jgi:hypothetical protein
LPFEAGVTEGQVAQHESRIVEGLAAEVHAEAFDVAADNFGPDGDVGWAAGVRCVGLWRGRRLASGTS